MEPEFILSRYGFDFYQFYEGGTLYKYRASIGFLVMMQDVADIVDLEECDVAGIC